MLYLSFRQRYQLPGGQRIAEDASFGGACCSLGGVVLGLMGEQGAESIHAAINTIKQHFLIRGD